MASIQYSLNVIIPFSYFFKYTYCKNYVPVIKTKFIIYWVVIMFGIFAIKTIFEEYVGVEIFYGFVGGLLLGIFMLLTRLDEIGNQLERFVKVKEELNKDYSKYQKLRNIKEFLKRW